MNSLRNRAFRNEQIALEPCVTFRGMAILKRQDDKIRVLARVPLFTGLSKKLGEIARLVQK